MLRIKKVSQKPKRNQKQERMGLKVKLKHKRAKQGMIL